MDAGAFVQENRRWLLGAAFGGLAWLIASTVIDSIYDPSRVATSPRQLGALANAYDQNALQQAREDQQALAAQRAQLEGELAFVVDDRFRVPRSDVDQYVFQVGGELKQAILAEANRRNVQVEANAIQWAAPNGLEEFRATLFGLDMLQAVQERLFAAHDASVGADPDALGLSAIQQLRIEEQRRQRSMRSAPKAGEVDLRELLDQQRVQLQFQADAVTATRFLEACRRTNRTLVVDSWQVVAPVRPGEPCTVKASVTAIAFRPQQNEERGE